MYVCICVLTDCLKKVYNQDTIPKIVYILKEKKVLIFIYLTSELNIISGGATYFISDAEKSRKSRNLLMRRADKYLANIYRCAIAYTFAGILACNVQNVCNYK